MKERPIIFSAERVETMNKQKEILKSFVEYCEKHPEQRFWQALRNWSEAGTIFIRRPGFDESCGLEDTFYFKDKLGFEMEKG